MDSWNFLLNMLVASRDLFRSIQMFTLRDLSWGLPYPSHFMKLARSSRACPLFHGRPRAYFMGSLERGVFNWKDISMNLSTPS